MQARGVISRNSPVTCERLRNVSFSYVDFSGQRRTGVVVVLDAVAPRVQVIFDQLYKLKFPLAKSRPIDFYNGGDIESMDDNNTSAFNSRPITGGKKWSLHAYGVAIDINPVQNPYISFGKNGIASIRPSVAALISVNRRDIRPNKAKRPGMSESVIDIFADNGFLGWGGYWNFPIDYQHFEIGSREFAARLTVASPDKAQRMFEEYVAAYTNCMRNEQNVEHTAARKKCVERVWQ
ncbi:M15 family metallopeptidase [Burkholderia sp. BCC0506]|uniref:M15 family metallopeptidase n=2 Tax=unclassified Burkholderia TaxID=2613784 RepID=UPI001FC7F377|nr:M15 family metallopeptidase [Burkholderia sp. BCC0506]